MSEPRRGPDGKFLKKKAIDTDYVEELGMGGAVGRVDRRHVSEDVRFHPVRVRVLEKVIELAAGEDSHVMLAVPTQHTKHGQEGCMILASNAGGWWDSGSIHDFEAPKSVYVGAGMIYCFPEEAAKLRDKTGDRES